MNLTTVASPRPSDPQPIDPARIVLSVAKAPEREAIYHLRHEVYARELGQHTLNEGATLSDRLDNANVYLVAKIGGEIAGFISITPPNPAGYSVDKYVARDLWPFFFDHRVYEIR